MEQFLEGNTRKFTVTFTNGSVIADPTTVRFYRRLVGGGSLTNLETYVYGVDAEVGKDSTGVYHATLTFPTDGRYVIGAEASGNFAAYEETTLIVQNAQARP